MVTEKDHLIVIPDTWPLIIMLSHHFFPSSSPSHLSSLHFLPPYLPGRGFPEIEDEENWHGKPLGQKAQAALDAVKALIKNPGPHGLSPLPFQDDAPPVVLPQVKLSEPPNYKLGDKVCARLVSVKQQ